MVSEFEPCTHSALDPMSQKWQIYAMKQQTINIDNNTSTYTIECKHLRTRNVENVKKIRTNTPATKVRVHKTTQHRNKSHPICNKPPIHTPNTTAQKQPAYTHDTDNQKHSPRTYKHGTKIIIIPKCHQRGRAKNNASWKRYTRQRMTI